MFTTLCESRGSYHIPQAGPLPISLPQKSEAREVSGRSTNAALAPPPHSQGRQSSSRNQRGPDTAMFTDPYLFCSITPLEIMDLKWQFCPERFLCLPGVTTSSEGPVSFFLISTTPLPSPPPPTDTLTDPPSKAFFESDSHVADASCFLPPSSGLRV
ncbi:hypothetical protein Q7C36_000518 [Tachysurus vachellii]|uniref:Uncharacterized protein n=1 Tax=Tachysurus vachellii TaxID=175792 RepID=A0AA88P1J4_TACVA|nr:hypothetical protein Q7C36_000518 [Tachysurus vachellii]